MPWVVSPICLSLAVIFVNDRSRENLVFDCRYPTLCSHLEVGEFYVKEKEKSLTKFLFLTISNIRQFASQEL